MIRKRWMSCLAAVMALVMTSACASNVAPPPSPAGPSGGSTEQEILASEIDWMMRTADRLSRGETLDEAETARVDEYMDLYELMPADTRAALVAATESVAEREGVSLAEAGMFTTLDDLSAVPGFTENALGLRDVLLENDGFDPGAPTEQDCAGGLKIMVAIALVGLAVSVYYSTNPSVQTVKWNCIVWEEGLIFRGRCLVEQCQVDVSRPPNVPAACSAGSCRRAGTNTLLPYYAGCMPPAPPPAAQVIIVNPPAGAAPPGAPPAPVPPR